MFRNRVFTYTTAIVFGASSLALAQTPAPGSQQPGQQQPSSQQTPERPQTQSPSSSQSQANLQSPVRGTLVSVDTDEETFIITLEQAGAASGAASSGAAGAAGATSSSGSAQSGAAAAQSGAARPAGAMAANQVEFNYDDDTTVTGAERGIAGLSAMKASRVMVHFVREGSEMKATRIEVQQAGATSPSSATPGSSSSPGSTQPRPQSDPNPDTPRPDTTPR